MPVPDDYKIQQLIARIRDKKRPLAERERALHAMEAEVNQSADTTAVRFTASLGSFEQQWQQFQQTHDGFMDAFDAMVSHDVDVDEVDALMARVQDEVRIERADTAHLPTDRELEQRLEHLRQFARECEPQTTLTEKSDLRHTTHSHQMEATPSSALDLNFLEDIEVSMETSSAKLAYLDDALQALSAPFEEMDVASSIRPTQNSEPMKVAEKKTSGFWAKVQSFFQSIANFFKGIGTKAITIDAAVGDLKTANRELARTEKALHRAQDRLEHSTQTVRKYSQQLKRLHKTHQGLYKKLRVQNAALERIRGASTLPPEKKAQALKKMRARIADTKGQYSQKSRMIHQLSRLLTRASSRLEQAHISVKDTMQMHKTASTAVKEGMQQLEQLFEKEHEAICANKQRSIKDLLQKSKAKFQQAHTEKQGIEDSGEDTLKF